MAAGAGDGLDEQVADLGGEQRQLVGATARAGRPASRSDRARRVTRSLRARTGDVLSGRRGTQRRPRTRRGGSSGRRRRPATPAEPPARVPRRPHVAGQRRRIAGHVADRRGPRWRAPRGSPRPRRPPAAGRARPDRGGPVRRSGRRWSRRDTARADTSAPTGPPVAGCGRARPPPAGRFDADDPPGRADGLGEQRGERPGAGVELEHRLPRLRARSPQHRRGERRRRGRVHLPEPGRRRPSKSCPPTRCAQPGRAGDTIRRGRRPRRGPTAPARRLAVAEQRRPSRRSPWIAAISAVARASFGAAPVITDAGHAEQARRPSARPRASGAGAGRGGRRRRRRTRCACASPAGRRAAPRPGRAGGRRPARRSARTARGRPRALSSRCAGADACCQSQPPHRPGPAYGHGGGTRSGDGVRISIASARSVGGASSVTTARTRSPGSAWRTNTTGPAARRRAGDAVAAVRRGADRSRAAADASVLGHDVSSATTGWDPGSSARPVAVVRPSVGGGVGAVGAVRAAAGCAVHAAASARSADEASCHGHARHHHAGLEQQPALEAQRRLVVQQLLPPVPDDVLRDEHAHDVARPVRRAAFRCSP